MDRKNDERLDLLNQFEAKEAGVADLAALYETIESIYIKASHALGEEPPMTISNSTNPKR